jgi:hypothetical protein
VNEDATHLVGAKFVNGSADVSSNDVCILVIFSPRGSGAVSHRKKLCPLSSLWLLLCGGGDREKLRADAHLGLATSILFVQGTRDRLCPLDILESVRREMKAANELYVVEGGDDSSLLAKSQFAAIRETQYDVSCRILRAIRDFLAAHVHRAQ